MSVLKYAIIGGICTFLDFMILLLSVELFGLHYLFASTVSFTVAVFLNYYLCVVYLFKSGVRFGVKGEVFSFFVISLMGLLIHQGILYCTVELLSIGLVLSKAVATAFVFTWNYLGRKLFVFSPPQFDPPEVG